jgi:hypothetical protein
MHTYSHIRRQALNAAAAALEPPKPPTPADPPTEPPSGETALTEAVMSQTTSQSAVSAGRVLKFARKIGSSGWIRTSNPPVNSNQGGRPPSLDPETCGEGDLMGS